MHNYRIIHINVVHNYIIMLFTCKLIWRHNGGNELLSFVQLTCRVSSCKGKAYFVAAKKEYLERTKMWWFRLWTCMNFSDLNTNEFVFVKRNQIISISCDVCQAMPLRAQLPFIFKLAL